MLRFVTVGDSHDTHFNDNDSIIMIAPQNNQSVTLLGDRVNHDPQKVSKSIQNHPHPSQKILENQDWERELHTCCFAYCDCCIHSTTLSLQGSFLF